MFILSNAFCLINFYFDPDFCLIKDAEFAFRDEEMTLLVLSFLFLSYGSDWIPLLS